jgi:beta-hydroxylase
MNPAAGSQDSDRERRRKQLRRERAEKRLYAGSASGPAWLREFRMRRRAAILRIGKDTRPWIDRVLVRYAAFEDVGFPDPGYFPWIKELESKSDRIRGELDALLANVDTLPPLHTISPDHNRIARKKWKAFFLYGYGHRSELGCTLCPETTKAVEQIPGLVSAFFSILLPGMHIKKHRGPTKSLMVCHLGVRIPQRAEKCVIRVGDQIRPWEQDKVLVFDDTHEHEVWNDTDETRVVLLIHVRRPLRFPGSVVGSFIYNAIRLSPFVRDGRKNLADWEASYRNQIANQIAKPPTDSAAN